MKKYACSQKIGEETKIENIKNKIAYEVNKQIVKELCSEVEE